ncbi:TraB/GumN family protein [Altererythrobacter sp. MF3-039]|uniref:TraB/GumN family protein n=1 Tax=Altererythrobacter sp. MF3-039 TaxID=3252901 RepID=UPI00390C7B3D
MRQWFVALAALFFWAAGCDTAQQPADPPSPALWQIESANGEVEGWLFGTIHALPDDTQWRTETFETTLADAEILVVEVADFSDTAVFRQLATTPGLPPLSERVSADRRTDLHQMISSAGISETRFANVEDWAAALTLGQIGRDADPENGVDQALIKDARNPFKERRPIPVTELEGLYAQLKIFDDLAPQDQRALLHSTIDEYATEENEAAELRQLWLSGDVSALEEAITESMAGSPGLNDALLTDRNIAMAAKVEQMLKDERKYFVAIGAAHLIGETGLPSLLGKQGYRIRRLQ